MIESIFAYIAMVYLSAILSGVVLIIILPPIMKRRKKHEPS